MKKEITIIGEIWRKKIDNSIDIFSWDMHWRSNEFGWVLYIYSLVGAR